MSEKSYSTGDMLSNIEPTIEAPVYSAPVEPIPVPETIPYDGGGEPAEPIILETSEAGATSNIEPTIEAPAYSAPVGEQEQEQEQETQAVIPAIGSIQAGDIVRVEVRNGTAVAIGTNGSGDRLRERLNGVTQYFYHDDTGAHVSDSPNGESGNTTTITSDGLYIEQSGDVLAEFSHAGVDFYADGIPTASFNKSGVIIGNQSETSMTLHNGGMYFTYRDQDAFQFYLSNKIQGVPFAIMSSPAPISISTENNVGIPEMEEIWTQWGECGMRAWMKDAHTTQHEVSIRVHLDQIGDSESEESDRYIAFEDSIGFPLPRTQYPAYIKSNIRQQILWQGRSLTLDYDSYTLKKPVTEQLTGIVLVFSALVNNKPENYYWNSCFVPKEVVELHPGAGHSFALTSGANGGLPGYKYIYIHNNKIVGHKNNNASGTGASGIKYNNSQFVLRYVLGV